MVCDKGIKENLLDLIELVKVCPILPFDFNKNKRIIIEIDNLLYMTNFIIEKRAEGICLDSDEEAVSIKKC